MDVKSKIVTQFIRDLSFENPQGPLSFQDKNKRPEIKVNLDVQASNKKDTNIFESKVILVEDYKDLGTWDEVGKLLSKNY